MNNKCICGHKEENHYLGTEGCAICYKVDKYLCTKFEPMKEKLLWDACGGIPGCNHPQGQQCDCPCHIPDVTKKEEAWKDELHLFWLGNKLGGRPHNEEEWKLFISYIISKAVEEARRE